MPPVGSIDRKPMAGLRAEHQVGVAQLFTSISHLADAGPAPRKLDAFGIGAAVPVFLGSTFKAEVAERRFQDGDGLGWSSSLVRTAGESNDEPRVTHAPGRRDAYARATKDLAAKASEQPSPQSGKTPCRIAHRGITGRAMPAGPASAVVSSCRCASSRRGTEVDS